jgi:signal transduction histidine kinase
MGLDTNWIDNGSNRYVAFSNLEPRPYELQVRVSAVIGQWSNEYKTLKITIQPAFWQTLAFKIMAWSLFIGLLIFGVRLYVRQQIRTERGRQEAVRRERERIFDEIHDELGAYLARIKYMADNLVQSTAIIKTLSIHKAVTQLSNTAIDALERMNDIIREISAPDDSLRNFTADLRAWMLDFCRDTQLDCHCDITGAQNNDTQLIGMVRHNLFLVVKQALRNTVQHAAAQSVTTTVEWNGHLEIIIQDNGKGFDPSVVKPESSGLRSMHKRMKKIGGTIDVQSRLDFGTTIRLSVPIQP